MDVRGALEEQYRAGLAMLKECVELCPPDLWLSGTFPRTYWRIAYHTVYFTHLYLGQDEASFVPWPARGPQFPEMWAPPWQLEPYELPTEAPVLTPNEIIDYINFVEALVDSTVNTLDLDCSESGFHWYQNIGKLSRQSLNIRHIQGHVGQLSELLMMRDIDIKWVNGAV